MQTVDNYFFELGGGFSRLLNALVGGDSAVTFSAASWDRAQEGSRVSALCVAAIDGAARLFTGERDHCLHARIWHVERGILHEPVRD